MVSFHSVPSLPDSSLMAQRRIPVNGTQAPAGRIVPQPYREPGHHTTPRIGPHQPATGGYTPPTGTHRPNQNNLR